MRMLRIEFLKSKKLLIPACILMPLIINSLICFDLQFRYWGYLILHQEFSGLSNWQLIFKEQTILYFSELCHIFAAVIVYQSFIIEKEGNAWMLIMGTPYKEKKVISGKWLLCMAGMVALLVTNLLTMAVSGFITGVEGPFETGLFFRVFVVQFFACGLMVSFYIFLATVFKKIIILIPVSIGFLFLNSELYYTDNIRFLPLLPFTYASHCFRATAKEMAVVIMVSAFLSGLFLLLSTWTVKRKEVLE